MTVKFMSINHDMIIFLEDGTTLAFSKGLLEVPEERAAELRANFSYGGTFFEIDSSVVDGAAEETATPVEEAPVKHPALTEEELEEMSAEALREAAKERGIPGFSRKNKAELMAILLLYGRVEDGPENLS